MVKKSEFVWSINWYIGENKAWFIGGRYNAIFELDIDCLECKMLAEIPVENRFGFRTFTCCLKKSKKLYCIPDVGMDVWIYDMERREFRRMPMNKENSEWFRFRYLGEYNDKFVLFSTTLNKVYILDTKQEKLVEIIDVFKEVSEKVTNFTRVEDSLYGIVYESGNIVEVNLEDRLVRRYQILNCKERFKWIIYTDGVFLQWGDRKEFGIWKIGEKTVDIRKQFPDDFGIYEEDVNGKFIVNTKKIQSEVQIFQSVVTTVGFLWCIPNQCNEILLINKRDMNNIEIFAIPEEEETGTELWKGYNIKAKFFLQGVVDERYLFLFSFKHNCVLRIDMQERTYEYLDIPIDMSNGREEEIYLESNVIHRLKYKDLLRGTYTDDRM